jgi:LemA protein
MSTASMTINSVRTSSTRRPLATPSGAGREASGERKGIGVLALIIVAVAIGALAAAVISIYNRLNALRERTRTAFSQIDVQLERRYDLIPNLVTVAQRYLAHEQDTLTAVIEARASATQARIELDGDPANVAAVRRLGSADGSLGAALGRLMAVSEQYPDLKADRTMADLTEEIRSTENRVAFARQAYNDETRRYETYRRSFPVVAVSGALGFTELVYLEVDEEAARKRVDVEFS